MTSEIRANTLKNRVGLGTVSFTNTGIVVSGIVTANSFSATGGLDIDGHTNLDNVSIAGITTISGTTPILDFTETDGNPDYRLTVDGGLFKIRNLLSGTYTSIFTINTDGHVDIAGNTDFAAGIDVTGNATVSGDIDVDGHTELDNLNVTGVSTFRNELQITPSNASSYTTHLNFQNNGSNFISCANGGATYFRNSTSGGTAMSIQGSDKSVDIDSTLRHLGNTNTLMEFGTDTISFDTAGTKRLRITSNGNTIISGPNAVAQTPAAILDVFNQGSTTQALRVFRNDLNDNTLAAFESYHNALGIVPKMVITSRGRVGINTNNPQREIHVKPWDNNPATAVPGYIRIEGQGSDQPGILELYHTRGNGSDKWPSSVASVDGGLTFKVATGNNGAPQERVRITSAGKVGINDSPQYTLDIQPYGGNVNQTPIIRVSNDSDGCHNAITLESSTSADKNIGIQFKNRNVVRGGIGYIQSDKMSFYSGTTPGGNGITINASGFVGVGKADPDRTFHVYRNSETWPAGFETNNTTCKISFKSAGTTNMYEVGVGAESRSLIFLTANSIRNDITTNGVMRTRTLGGGFYPVSSVRDGSTSARAAQSAWEIKKTLGPAARTGYYYLINPYDDTVSQWWCDMDTDGGGWILVAHTGEGQMSSLSTSDGNHWFNRSNKGGFDSVGSGYYKGGGYWRKTNGGWADNTCGQLMWDVRVHNQFGFQQYGYHDTAESASKVVFNWGTDQALPSGGSGYGNIPNAGNRRFNEWCYEVQNAPGYNPNNYHQNIRSNTINGNTYFTEHMVMTWSFRGTGGAGDASSEGPYWMIGSHHDGLHQHYEESLSGSDGVYGDGGYQVVSNQDTGWANNPSGTNNGMRRLAKIDNSGTVNVWLR